MSRTTVKNHTQLKAALGKQLNECLRASEMFGPGAVILLALYSTNYKSAQYGIYSVVLPKDYTDTHYYMTTYMGYNIRELSELIRYCLIKDMQISIDQKVLFQAVRKGSSYRLIPINRS